MAGLRDRDKLHFPLSDISSVVKFFKSQLDQTEHPNLALLSIVLGIIENQLTCNRVPYPASEASTAFAVTFPVVEWATVEGLYVKFESQIKGSVDLSHFKTTEWASRELVKKVSDVIWSSLTRSYYKDRAHLQSLYSYLTGNKLDCFGVAFAVVAAAQVLGISDVHLALSEDHAWITFGKDGIDTAEVTWHGKGNEDKRGQPITFAVTEKSWLYLNGKPVHCSRQMEIAALISGMNPSINATTDSIELGTLQKELLWMLYDAGSLDRYPMAIGNLADLEEIAPTSGRISCITLFQKAIESARKFYHNQHVYPYTYLGGYLYRHRFYKDALETWANAACVIRNYNYNREDEEIYKEFLEIANELIPHVMKLAGTRESTSLIVHDPLCFAYLLQFYDGICSWEEGSSTPVLHIGWAKPLVNTIAKFDAYVRSLVEIVVEEDYKKEELVPGKETKLQNNGKIVPKSAKSKESVQKKDLQRCTPDFIKSLENQINANEAPHPNIAALAAACGENILNPEYLLGSGEPFSSSRSSSSSSLADCREFLSSRTNGTPFPGMTMDSLLKAESPAELLQGHHLLQNSNCVAGHTDKELHMRPKVTLFSEKMKGVKELLLAEKLNGSAIQLQLTAQSQVQIVKRPRSFHDFDFLSSSTGRSTKRSRKE